MKVIAQYLDKQGISDGLTSERINDDVELIIVIPAYKEDQIDVTLSSLLLCDLPRCGVEVMVYVNGKASDSAEVISINEQCYQTGLAFQEKFEKKGLKLIVFKNLYQTDKKAGVGLARKVLMDEAVARYSKIGRDGLIVNLDADCTVARNYFIAILEFFEREEDFDAASVHFEHSVSNEAILQYELHLRYFIGMQRWAGFPFAFQTIGSAMVVRASAYAAQGGMNTRKAGEDFYFLHKFIKINTLGELPGTTVFPSARISDRVPFGTGKAVGDFIKHDGLSTYAPASFVELRRLSLGLKDIFSGKKIDLHTSVQKYLESVKFGEKILEIKHNTRTFDGFVKRFYQFFDAFKLMKCLHYLREEDFSDVSLVNALPFYANVIGLEYKGVSSSMLTSLREYDKKNILPQSDSINGEQL